MGKLSKKKALKAAHVTNGLIHCIKEKTEKGEFYTAVCFESFIENAEKIETSKIYPGYNIALTVDGVTFHFASLLDEKNSEEAEEK